MFKLRHLKGNTYYFAGFAACGVYDLGNGEVILIDSADHRKSVSDLDKQLEQNGWRVKAIFNTHGHIDHVFGNEFFSEKYGCPIYANRIERSIATDPVIEGVYFFMATNLPRFEDERPSHFHAEVLPLTEDVLPEGFEFVELPGHSFDHVGFKTPDNVWFVGDAVLLPEIFDSYHLPLFLFPNVTIKTCRGILQELRGDYFVPAHVPPMTDIGEIARINAEKLEALKEYVFSLCGGRSVEDILQTIDRERGLQLTDDRYAKMIMMLKAVLTSLMEDGRIANSIADGKMIYSRIDT